MNKRSLWLGVGIGIVLTSVLLGFMGSSPPVTEEIDEIGTQDRGVATLSSVTDEALREFARERGWRLISEEEWDKMQEAQSKVERDASASEGTPVYLHIPSGFSWQEAAELLVKAKVVNRAEEVLEQVKSEGQERKLKPGLYMFQSDDTPGEIVETLSRSPE